MTEHMISMFIDDELDLDDKIQFLEEIHRNEQFKNETQDFLRLEKTLRSEAVEAVPEVSVPLTGKALPFALLRPVNLAVMTMAVAVVILSFALLVQHQESLVPYRFVLYQPDTDTVEVAGSFTGWERVSMNRVGKSGYWELTLDLPQGDHRFVYFLEGDQRTLDPTILLRERDDFGGENSVFSIGESV
ncbi:MAG: glycogen-binding domain-containing protein [Desulfomonilia bacterium]